jgi:3D (Asp-Asp-Asp) domain-containing protein
MRGFCGRAGVLRLGGAVGVLAVFFLCGCKTSDVKRTSASPMWMWVRSTAYTHSEPGGARNAIGSRLRFGGEVSSAAADWSWMPLGTRFRIQETGRVYVVEDYGSGLVGKQTVDLYMPNESMMRGWGVRWVTLEILEWGSPAMSRMLLERRRDARPVRQMLSAMERTRE